jgi:hypothetical protein
MLSETLDSLARALKLRGAGAMSDARPGDAVDLYRESLDLRLEIRPERSIDIAYAEMDLGRLLVSLEQYEEAETLLLSSYKYLQVNTGMDSGQVQIALRALAALYKAWGKEDEAIQYQKLQSKPEIASTIDLGPLKLEKQGETVNALSEDYPIWFFGRTVPNSDFHPSALARIKDISKADDIVGFQDILNESGLPAPLLTLTEEEVFFNRVNKAQWELRPILAIMSPNSNHALLFYKKELSPSEGAIWGKNLIGISLAVWKNPGRGQPVRPTIRETESEPTILFPSPEPALGMAGALYNAGNIYAYATKCENLQCSCIVARAPFKQALDRKSWRFYNGAGWSSDWKDAVAIMNSPFGNILSVHWNNYLGKYVAFYQTHYNSPNGNSISMRTADRPEGPWSAGREVFAAVPPIGSRASGRGVKAHPALMQNDGQIEYITYARDTGVFGSEIRLVKIVFQ